jgi:hypothetical protein
LTLFAQTIETLGIRIARGQEVGTAPVALDQEIAATPVAFAALLATQPASLRHKVASSVV